MFPSDERRIEAERASDKAELHWRFQSFDYTPLSPEPAVLSIPEPVREASEWEQKCRLWWDSLTPARRATYTADPKRYCIPECLTP